MSKQDASEGTTSLGKDLLDLLVCTGGIYVLYLNYGVLHEKIYSKHDGDDWEFSLFLVFAQSCMHLLITGIAMLFFKSEPNKVPHRDYAQIGVTYMSAMFASSWALSYLNYPTQVLGKSCKMIPVMLMRILFVGTKYSLREYLAVLAITAGIAVFLIFKRGKGSGSAPNSPIGLGLLAVSLFFDGLTGPKQDAVRKAYKPSSLQMCFWMNFYPAILAIPIMVHTGEFFDALRFLEAHPDVVHQIIAFGILSALGQLSIVATVFRFDSLVLTTITTTRKFFSIMASVLLYGHELVTAQWMGVALVFGGLGLNMYNKYESKKAKQQKNA